MRKWIAIALLLTGVMQLIVRHTRRDDEVPLWDFTPNYIATHNWLRGGDPYDIESIRAAWREMTGSTADVRSWWSVYPPTTFVMLAPIGLMPPSAALTMWCILSVAVFVAALCGMAQLAGLSWRDARAWLFAGGVIVSAPFQFGLLSGQLSVVALSLAFLATWCIGHDRHLAAGVLVALAAALKPQVAAPFLLYYLVLRDWRATAAAIFAIACIAIITICLMTATDIDVVRGWSHNLRGTVSDGGVNDIDEDNPWRDQIVNLAVILQPIVDDPFLPRVVAMCFTAALLGLYVRILPHGASTAQATTRDMLPLATLSALSLLPIYHRVCDAMILMPAYAWALSQLDGPKRKFALMSLVPLAVFLVPFNAVNAILHRIPDVRLTEQWWWHAFLVPHYAWAVLAACIVLFIDMWQRNQHRSSTITG